MFSNLFYAFGLLQNTNSFDYEEKNNIFNYVKQNPEKLTELIKVLEEEKKGFDYIRKKFISGIEKAVNDYNYSIFPEEKNFQEINKNIKNIKKEEEKQKSLEEKELNTLFL